MAGESTAIVVNGATLVPGTGDVLYDLELRIDEGGLTQLGGDPVRAWQIPWTACRDVRVGTTATASLIALSFGALRYRWEVPADGIDGGSDRLVEVLRRVAGARAMVRGVRGSRRRG